MMESQRASLLLAVRDMAADDVDAVVDVHCRAFPEYLLTHMGRPYLRHYYSAFLTDKCHYALVADVNEKLAGFVVGSTDVARLHTRVYRTNILTALGVAGRFVADPLLRRRLLAKSAHFGRTFDAMAHRTKQATPSAPSGVTTRLLSIGVSPDSQRMGIAQKLVDAFCEKLFADGIQTVGLSVRKDNAQAIAFYERTNWQREREEDDGIYYVRSTSQLAQ